MKRKPPKKLSRVKARQSKEKTALLEHLEKRPIVEVACTRAGVSRATYYRWLKEDDDFADKAEYAKRKGRDIVNEMAESVIIRKIQEGDMGAAKYWLNNNHSNYDSKRKALTRPEEEPYVILMDA